VQLKCIVVDDDPLFQVLMKSYVRKGYNNRLNLLGIAENGEKAKSLYEKYKDEIDVIFLDVKMPDMSGFDFLDEIDKRSDVAIIMVTGEEERGGDAFEYGIVDYIVKPFTDERFDQAIKRVEESRKSSEG